MQSHPWKHLNKKHNFLNLPLSVSFSLFKQYLYLSIFLNPESGLCLALVLATGWFYMVFWGGTEAWQCSKCASHLSVHSFSFSSGTERHTHRDIMLQLPLSQDRQVGLSLWGPKSQAAAGRHWVRTLLVHSCLQKHPNSTRGGCTVRSCPSHRAMAVSGLGYHHCRNCWKVFCWGFYCRRGI